MAGVEGVEPSHTAPETAVLPLDDTPINNKIAQKSKNIIQQTLANLALLPHFCESALP